jgi:DNA-directed RNA polymerase specialized sigma54-like protein
VELPVTGGKLPPAPLTRRSCRRRLERRAVRSSVVEDEEHLARAVVDALRDEGYLVDHAADGEVALERIGGGRSTRSSAI